MIDAENDDAENDGAATMGALGGTIVVIRSGRRIVPGSLPPPVDPRGYL